MHSAGEEMDKSVSSLYFANSHKVFICNNTLRVGLHISLNMTQKCSILIQFFQFLILGEGEGEGDWGVGGEGPPTFIGRGLNSPRAAPHPFIKSFIRLWASHEGAGPYLNQTGWWRGWSLLKFNSTILRLELLKWT